MGTSRPRESFDFDAMVRAFSRQLHSYVYREFRGKVDPEDVLQDMWTKVYRLQDGFVADPRPVKAKLYEYAHRAAIDLLRREKRGGIPVDFQAAENGGDDQAMSSGDLRATGAQLVRAAREASGDPEVVERAVIVLALAALDAPHKFVVWAHSAGYRHREIAEQLSTPEDPVNEQQVKEIYHQSVSVMRPLIAHAADVELGRSERDQLHAYLDGRLNRRQTAAFRQHLKLCARCQDYIRVEEGSRRRAAHVLIPAPLLLPALVEANARGAFHHASAPAVTAPAARKGLGNHGLAAGKTAGATFFAPGGAKAAMLSTGTIMTLGLGVVSYGALRYDLRRHAHHATPVSVHTAAPALPIEPHPRPRIVVIRPTAPPRSVRRAPPRVRTRTETHRSPRHVTLPPPVPVQAPAQPAPARVVATVANTTRPPAPSHPTAGRAPSPGGEFTVP